MKATIDVSNENQVVVLASDIVYGQRVEWCNAKYRQLSLSLMRPRQNYPYDEYRSYPLIIWLCGGSFAEVDRNIWIPELVEFVKKGYAVASVDYSTIQLTHYPDQLCDIREAIRYLRAHAEELHIIPDKIALMGESAGGYLTALSALAPREDKYTVGEFREYEETVQAAVCWYPCVDMAPLMDTRKEVHLPEDIVNYDNLCELVTEQAPPFLILHGTADTLVPCSHSEQLYQALTEKGVRADFYLINGANHADRHFVNPKVKQLILDFLDEVLAVK